MPLGKPHHTQKRKNYTLLFILIALMVLFYAITLVRLTPAG
ncbi:MAG: hypothetical protein ACN2B6_07710 [Rickettsiales bacterium]